MHAHREVHRSTFFVADKETFPVPSNYVNVVRQTRTSMDKASEHTHNDCWNEESELSARYGLEHDDIPNLGEQAPRRIHMGKWSTHESTKTTRSETMWSYA